jgi:copper(I)-binding protein
MLKLIPRAALAALMVGAMPATPAFAHEYTAGSLTISHPWSRQTAPGARTGAGYLAIVNHGRLDDRLTGGSTPIADRLEVHSMTMDQGVMRMRPVRAGLVVPAGRTLELKPGGYHIMLIGLKTPLRKGDSVPAVLTFAKAGAVKVAFKVESIGASAPVGHGRDGHDGRH